MTTETTIPELLKLSAQCEYSIVAWRPDGDECQREDMTLEEYDALRHHLAKLRGLISD